MRGIPGLSPSVNPYETPTQAQTAPPDSLPVRSAVSPGPTLQAGMNNKIDPATGRVTGPAIPHQAPATPAPMYDMTIQATPPPDYTPVGGPSSTGAVDTGGQGLVLGSIQSLLDQMKTPVPAREPAPADELRVGGPNPAAYQGPTLAFSRAKDASSRIHGKALQALKDQMTSRGISGSGIEAQLMQEGLSDAADYQAGADLAQALASDERGWEAEKIRAAGDLTQRGQDIGVNTATTGYGVQQRGQDIGIGQGNSQLALALAQLMARTARY